MKQPKLSTETLPNQSSSLLMRTRFRLSFICLFFVKKKMFHMFSLNQKKPQERHAAHLEMLFAYLFQRTRDQTSTIRSEESKSSAKDSSLITNERHSEVQEELIHFILYKLNILQLSHIQTSKFDIFRCSWHLQFNQNQKYVTRIDQLVSYFFQSQNIEEMSKRPNQGLSRYRSTTLPNASKISILPKQFSSIERIGSGLTAEVYSCKHSKFGNVCVKIIHNSFLKSSLGEKLINNEISILEKLQHDNVIKFYQTLKCNDKRAIVTQFCQGGDMQKQIKSRKKYKEKEALHIFSQIIDGCKYLLQKDIIHRDLKPANILLKSKGCQVKLADFGFAVKSSDIELMRKNVGSPLYMAPQALSDLKYTQKSEVFSLGILLYQMLTGKTPWTAVSERDLLLKMKTTKPVKITECTQKTWEKIILKCLQIDSFKRANLKQLSNTVNEVISELNGDYGKINSSKNYLNNSYEQYQKQSLQIYKKGGKYQNNSIKPLLPKLPNKNKNRKVITTDRPLKKQSDSQQAHQKIKIASKKSQRTISTSHKDQKAESRFFSSAQIVRKINPRSYSFLPQSLMMKFQFIIQKYDYIVSAERNCQKGQKQPYKPKPSYEIQKDLMIAEVWRCSEEKELCQIILGFVRRLLRLTKNYLNLDQKNNAGYLEMFYKRVTEIAQ